MKLLPLVSVRGGVVFPNSTCPMLFGRPFSIASVKESLEKYDGKIIVTAQKKVEINDLPDISQIFTIGCVCKIVKHLEFPDGSLKTLFKAEERVKILDLEDVEGVRYGKYEAIKKPEQSLNSLQKERLLQKIKSSKEEWADDISHWIEYLQSEKDNFQFVMGLGHLLSLKNGMDRELTLEQIREGVFIVDTLSLEEKKTINLNLARVVEILESDDLKQSLKKIEILLT